MSMRQVDETVARAEQALVLPDGPGFRSAWRIGFWRGARDGYGIDAWIERQAQNARALVELAGTEEEG